MKAFKDITAFLFFVVWIHANTTAQQPYYQEQANYSSLAEIKQVTGIAADKNNCIWLTTQAGVFRYDGNNFRHYSVMNTPELKFERLSEIFTTFGKNGYGWYMRDHKENWYYIDSLSRIRSYIPNKDTDEIAIHNQYGYRNMSGKEQKISPVLATNIGDVYILPSNRRIFLRLLNQEIRSMPVSDFINGGTGELLYSNSKTLDKTFSTDKRFYLVTSTGFLFWEGSASKPLPVTLSGDIELPANKPTRFDSIVAFPTTDPTVILLGYQGCIYEAKETKNGAVLDTRLLVRDPLKHLPLKIFYSATQRILLSYFEEKGLVIYRPSRFSLLSWNGRANAKADYYYSIVPDRDGMITANANGIIRLGLNGEKKMLFEQPVNKFFLYKDQAGNTWFQDQQQIISYLSPGSSKSIPVLQLHSDAVFTGIIERHDSVYYILSSLQLFKFVRKNTGVFSQKLLLDKTGAGIELIFLYEVDKDVLWLGSDQGLIEFHLTDNTARSVGALGKSYMRSVIRLEKDNYLVGTYDKGIFQYLNKQWKQLPSVPGKLSSSAHGFVIDSISRCVWVSSNEGISRIPLNMLLKNEHPEHAITKIRFINNFGPDISPEFNGSSNTSAVKLSDTCIAFANAKGLVTFNPLRLTNSPLPARVLVESPENTHDSATTKRSNANQLLFTPVIPYYGDAGDLEIAYRLTGSDKDWNILTANSIISYNNIKPGNHDLQFRIRNSNAQDEQELFFTTSNLYVPARWYQTTWFKGLAIALAFFIAIILHNIRIWYLRKRKRELEQLVKTKTSELQKSNAQLSETIDDLKLSEENLKQSNYLKDEYFAVLTHDLRSPLRFLSFNICQLLDLLPELESAQLKKGLVVSYECTNDVSKLIDEFVYWIRNNENQLQAHPVSTMISPVMADVKKLYGFSLEGNNNKLVTHISPDISFTTDPQMFFIMLRNAVDNANKYTSEGTITVNLLKENNELHVTITDTGCGINEEMVNQLMQLQYEDVQFGHKKRRSLGFYIMAMLTKKLGGRYTINSVIGQGTVLEFILPELQNDNPSFS